MNNNSTTLIQPEVSDAMTAYETAASDTLLYISSEMSHVEKAKNDILKLIGAEGAGSICFTQSGTAACRAAIDLAIQQDPEEPHIVTTAVDHSAVRDHCENLAKQGVKISILSVDKNGLLNNDELLHCIEGHVTLFSMIHANHETGVVFPVEEIARIVKERCNALVHVDGACAAGRIPIDLNRSFIDFYSLSAHKFGGPLGIGAFFSRDSLSLDPNFGHLSSNLEVNDRKNIVKIIGMGKAAVNAADLSYSDTSCQLRNRLETALLSKVPDSFLNGPADTSCRLPGVSNISFAGVNAEMIMSQLLEMDILVSSNCACSSVDHRPSPTLEAMNVPYSQAMGAICFSLHRESTAEDVDNVIEAVQKVVGELRKISGGLFDAMTRKF